MQTSNIIHINYPDFEDKIRNGFIIVDFWAEWCQPCKVQEKILIELNFEYQKKFLIAKVNADDNKFLSKSLGVQQIPTLLFYKDGIEVERITSPQNKEFISGILNKYLN